MPDGTTDVQSVAPQKSLEQLLGEPRPRLHRYCARMTGSVIDGEDVVQETMLKAMETAPGAGPITNPEGWLFGIAHHTALDFLRRRAREEARHSTEDLATIAGEKPRRGSPDRCDQSQDIHAAAGVSAQQHRHLVRRARPFLARNLRDRRRQRPAVKAALQRGRRRLRALAAGADDAPVPALAEPERTRLKTYVERFNAHDFDAVRAMLAEDVRLEVVTRVRVDGKKSVAPYFSNYAARPHWRFFSSSTAAQRYSSMTPMIPIRS